MVSIKAGFIAGMVTGLLAGPVLADTVPAVALHCVRTSSVPTQADATWVKSFDVAIDIASLSVDKTTVLNSGERHDLVKNGQVTSNDAYSRTGIVSVDPDAVRFGYDLAPANGGANYRVLSTIDRTTGEAVDNLSTFLCRLKANQRLF